VAAVISVE